MCWNFKFQIGRRMSSRKRRHGDSGPSGGDTDDGNRNTSDEGVAGGSSAQVGDVVVQGQVVFVGSHVKVMVGTAKGVTKSYDSVSRKERRKKARERNRKNNEEPEPPEQAAARLKEEEQKRQTEAAERLEKRRRTHSQNTGEEISTDDFKRLEENGKQQRRQSGRSSTDANGQTRMDAFFPRKMGGGAAPSSHLEVNIIAERLPETLLQRDSEERGEPALSACLLGLGGPISHLSAKQGSQRLCKHLNGYKIHLYHFLYVYMIQTALEWRQNGSELICAISYWLTGHDH